MLKKWLDPQLGIGWRWQEAVIRLWENGQGGRNWTAVGNGFAVLFGVAFHKEYVLILNFTHVSLDLNHGYRMDQR